MKTYQDYLKAKEAGNVLDFIKSAINEYKESQEYRIACDADEYERENNITIMEFMRYVCTMEGEKVVDFTAANNQIASNFLHRLVTQRVAYSLGNGISFASAEKVKGKDGKWTVQDKTKEALGKDFDTVLYSAGRYARLHRVSYLFWNLDHADLFKATEFCPLFDENNGALGAGMRFWSLDWNKKPVTVVFYEQDGYTKYRTKPGEKGLENLVEIEPKRAYKQKIAHNNVDPDEIIGESNYSDIPIIPFWGSEHRQSDLVGMRSKIDAYDLVKSGFANDLEDCAEIYWIVGNALGMTQDDLAKFRDRLKLQHIVAADTDNTNITPYTQEIPTQARAVLLESLRTQIYEDYGGLDVISFSGGKAKTATEIEAAYQPMDEEADDFEYQCIKAVRGVLEIIGIDDMPIFQRNRVSNRMEQTQMVMMAANYLDAETVIRKLPFITPDEVDGILERRMLAEQAFLESQKEDEEEEEEIEEEGV